MGVDYNVYAGPYIVVFNPLKDSTEEFYSCPNKKCNNHNKPISDEFCSKCGTKIERMIRPCQERIDFNYFEEFEERFAEAFPEYKPNGCDDYLYLITNMKNDVGVHIDPKYHVSETVFDLKEQIEKLTEFTNRNRKEIRKLKNVFGEKNVQIKWGVLSWQS